MPAETPTLTGPIAEANYLMGRLLSGCDCLMDLGEWEDYEETWEQAIEFGEWSPLNSAQSMPKFVVTNHSFKAKNNGEDAGNYIPSGEMAVLMFIPTDKSLDTESERELAAYNFFGQLVAEVMAQFGELNNPGDQVENRTLFINELDLMGPTRTSQTERGPNGENDYYDAVLMVTWGQQT